MRVDRADRRGRGLRAGRRDPHARPPAVALEKTLGSLPPRGTLAHWMELTARLVDQPAGSLSEAAQALEDVASRVRRRGLVILISDLLVEERPTRRALRKSRSYTGTAGTRGHALPGDGR